MLLKDHSGAMWRMGCRKAWTEPEGAVRGLADAVVLGEASMVGRGGVAGLESPGYAMTIGDPAHRTINGLGGKG